MTRSIIGFFVALQACSSAATPTRSAVFRALVEQVVVPEAHALSGAQRALTSELAELERAPSEAALTTARTTWRAAALAWARMEALRLPVNDDGRCVLRATFWPTRSAQLEELLRDGSSLDADQIDALGIDVRGMYALEWLLFADDGPALLRADGEGQRVRQLARALAQNVEQYARTLEQRIGDGERWSEALSQDEAASLSRLVNITTAALEQLANERLGRALARSTRRAVSARELRGGGSGSSSELVQAQFALIERMYLGDARYPGIAALIKPTAPAIEQHLRARFQAAHERLGELDRPLEQLTQSQAERLSTSHAALRELERALKTEVSSALGVTLTFESSDGD